MPIPTGSGKLDQVVGEVYAQPLAGTIRFDYSWFPETLLTQAFPHSLTCRRRRLKCSEEKPTCSQCEKSDRNCHYAQNSVSGSSPTSSQRGSWGSRDAEFPLGGSLTAPDDRGSTSHGTSITSLPAPSPLVSAFANIHSHGASKVAPLPVNIGHPPLKASTFLFSHIPNVSADQHLPSEGVHPTSVKTSPALENVSPATQAASLTSPGQAPYEWWDQIAQDAVKSSENYQLLKDSQSRWSFEPVDVSRSLAPSPQSFLHNNGRHAPEEQASAIIRLAATRGNGIGSNDDTVVKEPWNTTELPVLSVRDLHYLQYYIDNVGPIFDLFDPHRSFSNVIPHLAMRNVGLLKSVLAVSARFRSLHSQESNGDRINCSESDVQFSGTDDEISTEFYFETLGYLSQAMQYPSYTRSQEILATAVLISSYECFHVNKSADWEKHLKGVFWIQRSQETNGEREGLAGAVWWAWLRQDIWAALWQKRRTLTIWESTKPVEILRGYEFACRATFLLSKAIKYAYSDNKGEINQRFIDGEKLFQELQGWYDHLPATYRPIPTAQTNVTSSSMVFPAVWIYPSHHAAAMQNYYSAMILLLLHRPTPGGVNMYFDVPRVLEEAVGMICGLAQCYAALDYPSAMVNFQALYVAGHCVRSKEHQTALYEIFERTLDSVKFPSKSLLIDLQKIWAAD